MAVTEDARANAARAAWAASVDDMEELLRQLDALPEGDPAIPALRARFDDAETEASRCRANFERLVRIDAARETYFGHGGPDMNPSTSSVRVGREALTYTPNPHGPSYFRDMVRAKLDGDTGAAERL